MSVQTVQRRPAIASAVVAVLVAVGVPLFLGSGAVRTGLAIELVGLIGLSGGLAASRRGWVLGGRILAGVGGAVCILGVVVFVVQAEGPGTTVQFLPALVGIPVLVAAVLPVRGSGSRTLVKLGVGGVFLSVLLAGLFRSVSVGVLLGVTAASVVAWDAGEHAVGIGEQLGRSATTWRLELVHVVGSVLVGTAAVSGVYVMRTTAAGTTSFAGFAMMAVALVLLVAALRP